MIPSRLQPVAGRSQMPSENNADMPWRTIDGIQRQLSEIDLLLRADVR